MLHLPMQAMHIAEQIKRAVNKRLDARFLNAAHQVAEQCCSRYRRLEIEIDAVFASITVSV